MPRSLRLFVFVVLFGVSLGHIDAAIAQSLSSASVEGTVADETKAALPGVSVTIAERSPIRLRTKMQLRFFRRITAIS